MRCAREGCSNTVPPKNRKYCSNKCRKIANQKRAYEQRKKIDARPVSKRFRRQKIRICLKCNQEFLSEGPWNRFCPNCAQKNQSHRTRTFSLSRHWPGTANYDRRES